MVYILNNVIKYDSVSAEITLSNSDAEGEKLTPVLNYIFLVLIENNESAMSREQLINEILSVHNVSISTNTLNQYLSILRKILKKS